MTLAGQSPTSREETTGLAYEGANHGPFLHTDVSSASQSSNMTCAADDEDEDTSGSFQFSWKQRMKEMDEESDDDDHNAQKIVDTTAISNLEVQKAPSPFVNRESVDTAPPSPRGAELTPDGFFGGSLSTLTSSLPDSSFTESFDEFPVAPPRYRGNRIQISDREPDEVGASSSASPTKFPITTPRRDSLSSPPTSEVDMPSRIIKIDKGKGKAPVRDVAPLQFDDELVSSAVALSKDHKGKRKEQNRSRIKARFVLIAPTKKDRRETAFEKTRIQASRAVEVQRTEDRNRYTLTRIFHRVKNDGALTIPTQSLPSSDPILPFSSSPGAESAQDVTCNAIHFGAPAGLLDPSPQLPSLLSGKEDIRAEHDATMLTVVAPIHSDDEELPNLGEMLVKQSPPSDHTGRTQSLHHIKTRILEQRSQLPMSADNSDDDLEVVPSDKMHVVADKEAAKRKSEKVHGGPSKGKARQSLLGKSIDVSPVKKNKQSVPPKDWMGFLRESAKPAFQTNAKAKKAQNQAELNRFMLHQAEQAKMRIVANKDREWKENGGRTPGDHVNLEQQHSLNESFTRYADQGLEAANMVEQTNLSEQDSDSEDSDEDYQPHMRGSGSPEPMENSDQENQDVPEDKESNEDKTDEEDNVVVPRHRAPRRSAARVVDSDDESENRPLSRGQSMGRILVPDTSLMQISQSPPLARNHRYSISSLDEQTEDENDKENDDRLMYDKSEDKENKAVVRHSPLNTRSPLESRPGSLFALEEGVRRSLSMSSLEPNPIESSGGIVARSPLKELLREDEDPFLSPSPSKSSFTTRLQQAAASHANTASPPPPTAVLQLGLGSPAALKDFRTNRFDSSQFPDTENDESSVIGFKPQILQFSQDVSLSPSLAPLNPPQGRGFSQLFSESKDNSSVTLQKPGLPNGLNDLSLTLDVGLQPALEVSGTLRRRADAIFEKEQDYVVESANQKPGQKEVLYVNDHGFLTQTRPEASSPEVYRLATPSQIARLRSPQSRDVASSRPPLRTISFEGITDSPEQSLRRLRRRSTSPLDTRGRSLEHDSSPSASPRQQLQKLNAYDVLGKHSSRNEKRKKLEKSEFVEAEAEESDEERTFGFGGRKKGDDDEEEDEDQDKILEGLVDDGEVDVQEKLVLEKVREHREQDDRDLEKLHRDAVEGKFRTKRRNRDFGLNDDSEDEDEDERARRIRNNMYKKRKIDGDHLEALGQKEETRAFYEAYQKDLIDDDGLEFQHLKQDTEMVDVDQEDDEEDQKEVVSYEEIREQVQRVAQNKESLRVLDPEDASWLDDIDEEGEQSFKVVSSKPTKSIRKVNVDPADFDAERPTRNLESEQHNAKMISWARGQHGRNQGTGRSAVGAAVTGHSKAKLKAGGGSLRTAQSSASSSNVADGKVNSRKLTKNSSLLATVSDRSSKFA
ncbi:hypothetical protein SERLADRAFT_413730 [Serpula lacrymans var. lacrymans S7.9]|nr:uncharacterized protein SERLADRAFT_413730 [Serpula lacrymans var. lacrymans S7.9]EGO27257.1 hypothetical protein SERLADRAFT_413730 [Serpula lacrymans var. lacrymans S7.9]